MSDQDKPSPITVTQWSALQSGEDVEIRERMEPQPKWRPPDATWRPDAVMCPHDIGDKIAVVCPECEGRGWEYCDDAHDVPTRLICDCNPGDDIEYQMPQVTVHSITARQVDGEWFWSIKVQLSEAP